MARESDRAKPLVSAFLCEKILTEKDGVQTYVRVVDHFTVPRLLEPNQAGLLVWLAIIVKSGRAKGKYNLSLRMNAPTGEVQAIGEETPFALNGGEHGVNANVMLALQVRHEGLFGIDVMIDEEVLAHVPFRVTLAATDSQTTERSTPSEPDGPHQAV
jgi:hypothetical protein